MFFPSVKIDVRLVEKVDNLPLLIYVPITDCTSWNVQVNLQLKSKRKRKLSRINAQCLIMQHFPKNCFFSRTWIFNLPFPICSGLPPKTHSLCTTPQFIRWQLVLFSGKSCNCELVNYLNFVKPKWKCFCLFLKQKHCLGVLLGK